MANLAPKVMAKRILVVDDEPTIVEILGQYLDEEGYAVSMTTSALEAVALIESGVFDLLLTDLKMPEMHGIELLRRAKAIAPTMRVVVFTALLEATNAIDALRCGADDYLLKPFNLGEVSLSVERALSAADQMLEVERLRKEAAMLREENGRLARSASRYADGKNGLSEQDSSSLLSLRSTCGAIAHTIRGEFALIGGATATLRRESPAAEAISQGCDTIDRSVEYSSLSLRRLLDYLEVAPAVKKEVPVLDVLRAVVNLVGPRLNSKVRLELQADRASQAAVIQANSEQLMLIMVDLVMNANYVLRDQGGTVKLAMKRVGKEIVIAVHDDGPGVDPKVRGKLLKTPVSTKAKGLGIGLYLANRLLADMGGTLRIQSSARFGTRVSIRLPMLWTGVGGD